MKFCQVCHNLLAPIISENTAHFHCEKCSTVQDFTPEDTLITESYGLAHSSNTELSMRTLRREGKNNVNQISNIPCPNPNCSEANDYMKLYIDNNYHSYYVCKCSCIYLDHPSKTDPIILEKDIKESKKKK